MPLRGFRHLQRHFYVLANHISVCSGRKHLHHHRCSDNSTAAYCPEAADGIYHSDRTKPNARLAQNVGGRAVLSFTVTPRSVAKTSTTTNLRLGCEKQKSTLETVAKRLALRTKPARALSYSRRSRTPHRSSFTIVGPFHGRDGSSNSISLHLMGSRAYSC